MRKQKYHYVSQPSNFKADILNLKYKEFDLEEKWFQTTSLTLNK